MIFSALIKETNHPLDLKDFESTQFIKDHLSLIDMDKDLSPEEMANGIQEMAESLEKIISTIITLFEQGFITNLPKSLNELIKILRNTYIHIGDFDKYEIPENAFIIHPSYLEHDIDLAVFTTFEKTEKPAYRLFKEHPNTLENKKIISIGFGQSMENPSLVSRLIYKQAFNSVISSYKEHKTIYRSTPFMPSSINSLSEDLPTGLAWR